MFFLFNFVSSMLGIIWELIKACYRDLVGVRFALNMSRFYSYTEAEKLVTVDFFRKNLRKYPNKTCLEFYHRKWTFQDLEAYSNKVANLFANKFKLKKGDCVALFMENSPEYVGIWLGLSKIGVISALINSNLKHRPLLHCVSVSNALLVVYNANLEDSVNSIVNDLNPGVKLVVLNDEVTSQSSQALVLNSTLKYVSDQVEYSLEEPIGSNDVIMYIYTSGTTGLPKPAIIKQSRYYAAAYGMSAAAHLTPEDRVFVTLPIYHANGHIIGIGSCIVTGATVILRKKFSASQFWKEAIATDATAFNYIGEICRFLVNQPVTNLERKHKIRVAIGNGLRKNVWEQFGRRFGFKCVEFYALTEGNCGSINLTSQIGCCGFVPLMNYLKRISPICVVRVDKNMDIIRDENGFCIESKRGEKGLMIGIIDDKIPTSAYSGYAHNKNASNSKIIKDVFKKGEEAFNSGDLMMCDRYGYLTFCDRLGDTYRWKGENVATIEIENTINSAFPNTEVVVYGVEIAEQEGKCGMAAIKLNQQRDFDLQKLAEHLKKNLASFARPVFVRIVDFIDYTGTFKIIKNNLVKEGYDLTVIKDKIYYLESKTNLYKQLTPDIHKQIKAGSFRM